MPQPILTRDGLLALRQLQQLLPFALPETILDVAEWAIDLARIEDAPIAPDLATEAAVLFRRADPGPDVDAQPAAPAIPPASPEEGPPPVPASPIASPPDDAGIGDVPTAPPVPRPQARASGWPEEDAIQLRALVDQGLGWAEIGKKMDRNPTAVRLYARRRGIALQLAPTAPVARSPKTAPRPMRVSWTDEDDRRLVAMRSAGHATSAIAKALGRSEKAVIERGRRLQDKREPAPAVAPAAPEPDPAPEQVAPKAASSTGPGKAVAVPGPKSAREHHIEAIRAHLDRMPFDERFDAARDHDIACRLLAGTNSKHLAQGLGMSLDDLAGRFRAMIPASIRDKRGFVTIDGRALLLEALRLNAEEDEGEA